MFGNDRLISSLGKSLDRAALRQKVTAQNVANLNTPGYKRSYVTFGAELERARGRLPLERTNPRHLPRAGQEAEPRVEVERHTLRRADESNVDLDEEMLELVTNQLHYNALVQKINGRCADWRYIVNDGRR
ncbi:MAG: flagellar basal body rod protein FlgB [Firmicutes bacterium]|nr:flagellar basal body rod protein FlgB [Bacillota bacterium]